MFQKITYLLFKQMFHPCKPAKRHLLGRTASAGVGAGAKIGGGQLDEDIALGSLQRLREVGERRRAGVIGEGLASVGETEQRRKIEAAVTPHAADDRIDDRDNPGIEARNRQPGIGRQQALYDTPTDGAEADENQPHVTDKKRPR